MDGTHRLNNDVHSAVGALPAVVAAADRTVVLAGTHRNRSGRRDGYQSIHDQPPQADDSEGSSDEVVRPQRISKILHKSSGRWQFNQLAGRISDVALGT